MSAAPWENLDDFLVEEDFAVSAEILFQGGGRRVVSVLFDDQYLDAQINEYIADSSDPRVQGKERDFSGVERGDSIIIGGKTYDIMTGPQSDGSGWATLSLSA